MIAKPLAHLALVRLARGGVVRAPELPPEPLLHLESAPPRPGGGPEVLGPGSLAPPRPRQHDPGPTVAFVKSPNTPSVHASDSSSSCPLSRPRIQMWELGPWGGLGKERAVPGARTRVAARAPVSTSHERSRCTPLVCLRAL